MAKMKKAVTMSDIAEKVQVSTVTVSKALSGQKGVSEEMRERIIELAREMGYRMPRGSQEPSKESIFRIGVLIPSSALSTFDSFYWRLYQAVSEKAMQKNCFTGYESLTGEMEQDLLLPRLVSDRMADGLIVIGRPEKRYGDFLIQNVRMPLVFLDFYEDGADCFISDSFYGTYRLTNYLLERGHKRIAFVGTLFATESITDRYLGYSKAMMEAGQEIPQDYVIPDREVKGSNMHNFSEFSLPEQQPTAYVCNCDYTASLLIPFLQKKGIRVPEDISVVGFDNFPGEHYMGVGVTTYAADLGAMAKAAVRSLIRQMNGESVKKGIHIVEGNLVEKDSVRECRRD